PGQDHGRSGRPWTVTILQLFFHNGPLQSARVDSPPTGRLNGLGEKPGDGPNPAAGRPGNMAFPHLKPAAPGETAGDRRETVHGSPRLSFPRSGPTCSKQ